MKIVGLMETVFIKANLYKKKWWIKKNEHRS
jgi:hypothetical protein